MNCSDAAKLLHHYILTNDLLLNVGYPVERPMFPGKVIIYKNPLVNVCHNPPATTHSSSDKFLTS